MRTRLVSFDLDGTLVDTAGEIAAAANRAIAEFGLATAPVPTITALIGAGGRELMRRLLAIDQRPGSGDDVDLDAVYGRFAFHYGRLAGTGCQPYVGCAEALNRLRRAGVLLVCLTNKDEAPSRTVLQSAGIDEYFDLLVGGDTLAWRKPDRRMLEHVATTLAVGPAAMVHVGDSRTDVEAARNAGVTAWAVPYGYNGGEPIEAARPDRIFASLNDVADAVLAGNDG